VDVKSKKLKQLIAGRRQSASSTCEHFNVHHKGSSARFIRTTCSNCNELLSNVERNPPTTDPDLCRHRRTDHRGSNKHVRKTFCLDCGTHIESIPQSLVGEEVSGLSAEEQALVDCVNEHDTISREQIVCAAELMLAESRRLLPGEYSLLSIGKMFIDCADRAITSPSPIVPVPERRRPRETAPAPSPTAIVMTLEKEALVATLHKDNCPTNLRVVDPFTDAGVWALVDDGCNSCTHSDAWRLNAEEKWNKLGFSSYLKDSKITKFTGVGSAPSTGKWKLPVALQLKESKLVLPGAIDSHEIANSRHPLLISQGCQAKLGFTKSSRKGTITLDDYQNQGLEVARQAKTGLFLIRIDHLLIEQYQGLPSPTRSLLVDHPNTVDSSSDEDEQENRGYVATNRCKKFLKETLNADTIIVSCDVELRSVKLRQW